MDSQLKKGMIIPAIVLAEYIKIAGSKVGSQSALVHISELEARGGSVVPVSREVAVMAGNLLLAKPAVPMADALIAATAKVMHAEHVLSDDPHFKVLGIKTLWLR